MVFTTNKSEKQDDITFCTNLPKKRKRFHLWKCHVTMTEKRKNVLIWNCHETMTKKVAFISNEKQLQIHSLTFIHEIISLFSATSILSVSRMAYNTTAFLDKLTCTDYVDFGKCQDRFGQFSWSKIDSHFLDVKLKMFNKNDNREFRPVQNLTMGEADSN